MDDIIVDNGKEPFTRIVKLKNSVLKRSYGKSNG